MKILAVCQHYYPEPFVIYKIMEQLVSFGHEVHVVTGLPNYGYHRIMDGYNPKGNIDEIINGVHVHRVKIYPRKESKLSICKNYLSYWINSKKYVKTLDDSFDLVFSMTLSPVISASAGNLYSKKHKVPHIHYCVDLWPESLVITNVIKPKGLIYDFFYKWSRNIYQHADKLLVSSPSFIDYFKNVLKLDSLDYGVFPQPCLEVKKIENPIEYKENTINIVYCGNMGKVQALNHVYEAMEEYKGKDIYFHFIGMGSEKEKFFNEVKERGLENQVIDHGPLPSSKAASYFVNADALYVSLTNNGYVGKTIPNKLMFYLSFGKPLIAMVDHDARDLLKETEGALIVDQSTTSLVEAIGKFMELTKEEKEKLGHNNQVYYQTYFTLESLSRKLEEEMLALKK